MVEAENYSRTKTPLEVQLIPILGQEFQPCIQYNFLSTGVISMGQSQSEWITKLMVRKEFTVQ